MAARERERKWKNRQRGREKLRNGEKKREKKREMEEKVSKAMENIDWESLQTKYSDIFKLYIEQ